jgi:ABC-type multidrug transport system ATPase subunit
MIFIYICCAFLLRWRSRGSQHKKTGTGSGEPLCGLSEKIIVDDISLAIPQQKMTVLVGANGCGKSTLLSTIARLLQPLGGAAFWTAKRFTSSRPKPSPASLVSCRSPAAAGRVNRF